LSSRSAFSRRLLVEASRQPTRVDHAKTFTARAMTSPRTVSEMTDCTAIAILAHGTSGIASVGLNAVALVNPR